MADPASITFLRNGDGGECSSRTCIVTAPSLAEALWKTGYFGSSTRSTRYKAEFIGGQQRTSSSRKRGRDESLAKPVPETVQLSLMEANYLSETRGLAINDAIGARLASPRDTFESCYGGSRISFEDRFVPYKRFRDAGLVPKSGTQYGGEYVLYSGDPTAGHSKYCALIEDKHRSPSLRSVLAHMRVAEQTKKQLVLVDNAGQAVLLKRWVCKHEEAVGKHVPKNESKRTRPSSSDKPSPCLEEPRDGASASTETNPEGQ
jgi:tRNA-intron lyase